MAGLSIGPSASTTEVEGDPQPRGTISATRMWWHVLKLDALPLCTDSAQSRYCQTHQGPTIIPTNEYSNNSLADLHA